MVNVYIVLHYLASLLGTPDNASSVARVFTAALAIGSTLTALTAGYSYSYGNQRLGGSTKVIARNSSASLKVTNTITTSTQPVICLKDLSLPVNSIKAFSDGCPLPRTLSPPFPLGSPNLSHAVPSIGSPSLTRPDFPPPGMGWDDSVQPIGGSEVLAHRPFHPTTNIANNPPSSKPNATTTPDNLNKHTSPLHTVTSSATSDWILVCTIIQVVVFCLHISLVKITDISVTPSKNDKTPYQHQAILGPKVTVRNEVAALPGSEKIGQLELALARSEQEEKERLRVAVATEEEEERERMVLCRDTGRHTQAGNIIINANDPHSTSSSSSSPRSHSQLSKDQVLQKSLNAARLETQQALLDLKLCKSRIQAAENQTRTNKAAAKEVITALNREVRELSKAVGEERKKGERLERELEKIKARGRLEDAIGNTT